MNQSVTALITSRAAGYLDAKHWERINRCGTGGRDYALRQLTLEAIELGRLLERERINAAVTFYERDRAEKPEPKDTRDKIREWHAEATRMLEAIAQDRAAMEERLKKEQVEQAFVASDSPLEVLHDRFSRP